MNWRRASAADNLDGYARTVLVRAYLAEQRVGWWKRVRVVPDAPDAPAPDQAVPGSRRPSPSRSCRSRVRTSTARASSSRCGIRTSWSRRRRSAGSPGDTRGRGSPGAVPRAEPIHGRRADWLIEPGAPGSEQIPAEFRFRYRDAWAKLQINGKEIADVATVRRIAESVRFDGAEPAKFPVRIENLPQGMGISGARVEDGVARATFTLAGSEGGELMITVGPTTEASLRNVPSHSNTTLDGHPAFDSHRPHDGPTDGRVPPTEAHILNVYNAGGADIRLDARGRRLLEQLEPTGGLTGLYRRITWLGPDESTWTTTPLG
ncbi:hypothetical protein GCM10010182_31870 [Actinomadura cremea]|nr:hypothetical protein GCM10010182_31870 [Actinomadura cremea]